MVHPRVHACKALSPAPATSPATPCCSASSNDITGSGTNKAAENSNDGGLNVADSRWVGTVLPSSCMSHAIELRPGFGLRPRLGIGVGLGLGFVKATIGRWTAWGS